MFQQKPDIGYHRNLHHVPTKARHWTPTHSRKLEYQRFLKQVAGMDVNNKQENGNPKDFMLVEVRKFDFSKKQERTKHLLTATQVMQLVSGGPPPDARGVPGARKPSSKGLKGNPYYLPGVTSWGQAGKKPTCFRRVSCFCSLFWEVFFFFLGGGRWGQIGSRQWHRQKVVPNPSKTHTKVLSSADRHLHGDITLMDPEK